MVNQVRSGQVRSECLTCTSRASCCSARLSRAHAPLSGTGKVWLIVLAVNCIIFVLFGGWSKWCFRLCVCLL